MGNNLAGNITFPTAKRCPASVREVVAAIITAESSNQRVRAVGSAWSFTDVAYTTDMLISLEGLHEVLGCAHGASRWGPQRHVFNALRPNVVASDLRLVYFQAGITVNALYRRLDNPTDPSHPDIGRDRWALPTMGASSGQQIAGVISTATHGGDHERPPIADMLRAIHLVGPGGVRHWIERADPAFRMTEPAPLAAALPGLMLANIHYDDNLFRAAMVGVGCLGIIVEVIAVARRQYGLSQQIVPTNWSTIEGEFRAGRLFESTCCGVRHPLHTQPGMQATPVVEGFDPFNGPRRHDDDPMYFDERDPPPRGVPVTPVAEGLEIFLNLYRADDDYSKGRSSRGERHCLVVSRAYGDGEGARPFDGDHQQLRGDIDSLGVLLDVKLHGPDAHRRRIDGLMATGRNCTHGYPVAHSVLDTFDGLGALPPALSLELAITTDNDAWLHLVDRLLGRFDEMIASGMKYCGFLSLRFTRPSDGLLAMQQGTVRSSTRFCHIEVFGLKALNPLPDDSGNLEGYTDDFVRAFEDELAAVGGRMHWGQLHRLDRARVEDSYRLTLSAWRQARTELVAGGAPRTFSNDFSLRCGLEANTEVVAATTWDGNRYDVFAYDARGDIRRMWCAGGTWNRARLPNPFGAQRFLGPLTAASWGSGRIDLFGLGRSNHLLQMCFDGGWHSTDLGNPFNGDHFLGPIAAVSWGRSRIDIFGLGASGNVLRTWFDNDWYAADLGNGFDGGQRFSGTLSACSQGRGLIDIFGLGLGGALLQLSWDGAWHWTNLDERLGRKPDSELAGAPAAASRGNGHLDLLGRSRAGDLVHHRYDGNWTREVVANQFPGEVERFGLPIDFGPDLDDGYYVYQRRRVRPSFLGPIAAASWGRDRFDAFGLGERDHVLHAWRQGSRWSFADLGPVVSVAG